MCAVACMQHQFFFSAVATCYRNNLWMSVACHGKEMPPDRDKADTPVKRLHPSLMIVKWRDWATVAWWSGRQPLSSLTFQQLIIIVYSFTVAWFDQFMLVVKNESQLIHDIQKQGVLLKDFPKSDIWYQSLLFSIEKRPCFRHQLEKTIVFYSVVSML